MLSKLPSLLRSKKGFVGALVLFYGAVHGIFGLVQDATYAASNWGTIVGFLASGLGNLFVIVAGVVLILWAVFTQQPEAQSLPQSTPISNTKAEQEAEQFRTTLHDVEQERNELKARNEVLTKELATAQTRSHPEPSHSAADEPFSLEPVKRRGPPKPNGEFDIYMSVRVTNNGSGQIRGCRGQLVRVQDLVSTPDGPEWRDIPHIHPALLRWSPGDGGGDSTDFTTEATLDVAVIESWAEPVYQFLTANESLRSTYQLEYGWVGPILTVEISAQSGYRVEQTFNLDGHLRDLLEAPAEVEPMVKWRTYPRVAA